MTEFSYASLLKRDPIPFDRERVRPYVEGKKILVTGAAGSIGSEICRQLMPMKPKMLCAMDHAETPLFWLKQELPDIVSALVDVSDSESIQAYRTIHWDCIFHAAAYKHVSMCQENQVRAYTVNVIGTLKVLCLPYDRFVLVSTDKACTPVSFMGYTKQLAEFLVNRVSDGRIVRLGNVLGSQGSVIQIWEEQIKEGFVKVNKDARRYFLTVQEAAQILITVSTLEPGTYVPDMGEQVMIFDLARRFVSDYCPAPFQALLDHSGVPSPALLDVPFELYSLGANENRSERLVNIDETLVDTEHPKLRKVVKT